MELTFKNRAFLSEYAPYIWMAALGLFAVAGGVLAGQAPGGGSAPYYLAALVLPLAVAGALKDPFIFALGVYAVMLPFDSLLGVSTEGPGATATKYLGVLCIFVLLLKGTLEHRLVKPDRSAMWWLLFMVLVLTTLLWAPAYGDYSGVAGHFGLFLLYLTASAYSPSGKDMANLKTAVFLGGVAGAVYLILNYHLNLGGGRATLAYGERSSDPNELVFSISFAFAVCLSYLQASKGRLRTVFVLAVLGLMAYSVVLTGSRGGLIGVILITLTYLSFSRKRGRLVLGVLAVSAVAVYLAPPLFFQRLMEANESGGAGRVDIWRAGLETFRHYWLVGGGVDSFMTVAGRYWYGIARYYEGGTKVAHNIFLQVAVEFGAVGLGIMFVAIVMHYGLIRAVAREARGEGIWLMACLAGTLAQGMFVGILWNKSFWLFWSLVALYGNVAILTPGPELRASRGRDR